MVWKIWSTHEPSGVYGVSASSFDNALAAIRKICPQADTGQPCIDAEVEILVSQYTRQSLHDGVLIPRNCLNHYNLIVDRYNV